MSLSPAEQRTSYPLAAYNFRVTVDGAAMRFSKVSGLQREYSTATFRHGFSFVEGEQITRWFIDSYQPVTLEQGVVIGSPALRNWLERRNLVAMEVSLCDVQGVPVVAWRIAKALPVKLSAPSFDASSNEVVIDTLEVQARGISVVHL